MARVLIATILALLLLLVALLVYAFGGPLGYAEGHVSFGGGKGPSPLGSFPVRTKGGLDLGIQSFYLPAGYALHADYKVTVRRGAFRLSLLHMYQPIGKAYHVTHRVAGSAAGRQTWTVPVSGFYKFFFDGSPEGNGYDVDYQVTWSIAPPG